MVKLCTEKRIHDMMNKSVLFEYFMWIYVCMSLDGVFQLIWYQFVFRLRFNRSSFVFCVYTTLDVVFSANLFSLFLTLNLIV